MANANSPSASKIPRAIVFGKRNQPARETPCMTFGLFFVILAIAKTNLIILSFRRMFGYNESRPERHAPASIESIQKYGSRASFKGCPLVCTKGPIHGTAPRIPTIRTPLVKAASRGIVGVGGPLPCGRPTPAKRSSQTSATNANQRIVTAVCGSPRNVGVTPLTRAHR